MDTNVKKFVVILVSIFLVLGLVMWFSIRHDAKYDQYKVTNDSPNLDPIGIAFENQGQEHIKVNDSHPPYNSNPPTSGWHWAQPASWGVYDRPLVDEQAVHNLEHGGIWITYKDIDEETVENLKKITKANSRSIILSPRDANNSKIALASWTYLLELDGYDEAKILEFILLNKNKAPESFAR